MCERYYTNNTNMLIAKQPSKYAVNGLNLNASLSCSIHVSCNLTRVNRMSYFVTSSLQSNTQATGHSGSTKYKANEDHMAKTRVAKTSVKWHAQQAPVAWRIIARNCASSTTFVWYIDRNFPTLTVIRHEVAASIDTFCTKKLPTKSTLTISINRDQLYPIFYQRYVSKLLAITFIWNSNKEEIKSGIVISYFDNAYARTRITLNAELRITSKINKRGYHAKISYTR